jgi:plasmid stabilization system protein ParE
VKLVFARRVLREIERNGRWWVTHRDAKTLFEEELARALRQIREDPTIGAVYRVIRNREQRRILMPKTARHVYYRLDGPERILILSVWGARRRRGPKI